MDQPRAAGPPDPQPVPAAGAAAVRALLHRHAVRGLQRQRVPAGDHRPAGGDGAGQGDVVL